MTLMPSCLFNPSREGRKESPDADLTASAAFRENPVCRWSADWTVLATGTYS